MEAKRITDHRSYKISDEEVVKRVLEGEKELYEVLLRRYNQTLYRVVRGYLQDETEVDDVMQDTYLKAWEKLDQFREEASFSTWLIRIGINEALMLQRKQKKNRVFPVRPSQLDNANSMPPETKAIQHDTRKILEQAIDQLPEKYRVVYLLREVEGLDNRETAECLQLSKSNTKVRLHRARLLLKNALYKLTDGTDAFEFGNTRCDALVDTVMGTIF